MLSKASIMRQKFFQPPIIFLSILVTLAFACITFTNLQMNLPTTQSQYANNAFQNANSDVTMSSNGKNNLNPSFLPSAPPQFSPSLLQFPSIQSALTSGTYTVPMQFLHNQNPVATSGPQFVPSVHHNNTGFPSYATQQPTHSVAQNTTSPFGSPHGNFPSNQSNVGGWNQPPVTGYLIDSRNANPVMPFNMGMSQAGTFDAKNNPTQPELCTGTTDALIQYLLEEQHCLRVQLNY